MLDALLLAVAGLGTALACGLGVIPVVVLGRRVRSYQPALTGMAAGLMATASLLGLIVPGVEEGGVLTVLVGVAIGVGFLMLTRRFMHHRDVGAGRVRSAGARRSLLVFVVLLVHSLPEGFAMGTAFASDRAGLSLFVIMAIGLQNVPEGTAVSIPMQEAGFSPAQQFWAAVATSLPQPVGALLAFALVEEVAALLPVSFGFAAGAMLALVVTELAPNALSRPNVRQGSVGFASGTVVMVLLSWVLGV